MVVASQEADASDGGVAGPTVVCAAVERYRREWGSASAYFLSHAARTLRSLPNHPCTAGIYLPMCTAYARALRCCGAVSLASSGIGIARVGEQRCYWWPRASHQARTHRSTARPCMRVHRYIASLTRGSDRPSTAPTPPAHPRTSSSPGR